jgi:hypothetical protein
LRVPTTGPWHHKFVRSIIESNSDVVPLVIEAHNHQDDQQIFNGVNYITTYSASFSHCSDADPHDDWRLVEIDEDSIEIMGMETHRV